MTKEVIVKDLEYYSRDDGSCPYGKWKDSLKTRDFLHVEGLEGKLINCLGDRKSVGNGVFELRNFSGKGWRIYYGETADKIIIILVGGNKDKNQKKDVAEAKIYWQEYCNRELNK